MAYSASESDKVSPAVMPKKDHHPLALTDTLRDLALLRVSDIDLGQFSSPSRPDDQTSEIDASVDKSYKFASEARKAIKIHNSGEADTQGNRVDELREKLDVVSHGLNDAPS